MLVDKLNKYGVSCEDRSLGACPEDNSLFDSEGCVIDADFNKFLDELDEYVVTTEDHPVDRRAGLVHVVRHNGEAAYYDGTGDFCWKKTR